MGGAAKGRPLTGAAVGAAVATMSDYLYDCPNKSKEK